MLLNTTYHNEEHEKTIAKLIGGPYSFFKSLKLRGVGSKRMIIDKTSYNLNSLLNRTSDLNYANIEIRPTGIIIYINTIFKIISISEKKNRFGRISAEKKKSGKRFQKAYQKPSK